MEMNLNRVNFFKNRRKTQLLTRGRGEQQLDELFALCDIFMNDFHWKIERY